MTIEERAAQAAQYKATGACNCTQAVIKVFEDKISTDEKELMELTAGFAAGMGSLESTCGALIGAVMTAGVLTEGKGTPRFSREILQKFSEKSGATICKELKGAETGKVLCECPECVRNAVLALGDAGGSVRCFEKIIKYRILSVCEIADAFSYIKMKNIMQIS